MKRLAAGLAGAAILAGVLAGLASADPRDHGGRGGGQGRAGAASHGPGGYGGERRGPEPRWGAQGGPGPQGGPPNGPPGYMGPPTGPRWDEQQHNGYWIGNRWHYGPPPGAVGGGPGFRPGYAPWRRGALLPPYYRNDVVEDYGRYHLRRPPMGYHWVQVGQSFLLVSMDTGLIFDVVDGF
jgi:Ni/Co efflux regulator RcnB